MLRVLAEPPELLTVKEAAEILRVSEATIRRRISGSELKAYRTGHSARAPLRVRSDELREFVYGGSEAADAGG